MAFDRDYFDEDTIYCKYIFDETGKLKYNFNNEDVKRITNIYIYLLKLKNLYNPETVIVDEDCLYKAIDKYLKEEQEDVEGFYAQYDEDYYNQKYKERTKVDEERHSMGGYAYNDSYDDLSFDEIDEGPKL